ncbi:MAG: hypoxanthine phosphoribosyltransferase [Pseudomonadales bacterium]|nr:hypoxanthine phosphoribosyltransferase [Halioglobus sp.]MCP5123547.1 hypoxanthine phosphoribosyltransferase [Pseudomonadales bacterium]MCP5193615.1 hypoxanthine phosphoribosyltransferase [Pseudomonadales bacterium]
MNKQYITPQQLLEDAFTLACQVFESGFRPSVIVGVWRGGTPVAIAVHELLHVLGVEANHAAVRTRSYTGIGQREQKVEVDGLDSLVGELRREDSLLLVDDVHDTGLSLQQIVADLGRACADQTPRIRIATPYFKPGSNRTGRNPDYFLHSTDNWLVFPHELAGLTLDEIRDNKPEMAALLPRLAQTLG